MIKLRIEGTELEINDFLSLVRYNHRPNGQPILDNKAVVSKFYPNRVNSNDLLNGVVATGKNTVGRVYVEFNN
jgi:hypothetical protein